MSIRPLPGMASVSLIITPHPHMAELLWMELLARMHSMSKGAASTRLDAQDGMKTFDVVVGERFILCSASLSAAHQRNWNFQR